MGVLTGHSVYSLFNAMVGRGGSLGESLTAGLWLATAAFCSGTAWQPTVNFLHDAAGCNFAQTFVGCGAVTGFCFFVGTLAFCFLRWDFNVVICWWVHADKVVF